MPQIGWIYRACYLTVSRGIDQILRDDLGMVEHKVTPRIEVDRARRVMEASPRRTKRRCKVGMLGSSKVLKKPYWPTPHRPPVHGVPM